MTLRRIGVLTSGGDCAGLNAVLRAIVKRAINGHGLEVVGIRKGISGLYQDPPDTEDLKMENFNAQMMRLAGTVLGTTNRGNPFDYPMPDGTHKDRSHEVITRFKDLSLDGLIAVGGDGSLEILRKLTQLGDIPFIGIPKTIDNDVGMTEVSVGYSTAVHVATNALDRLQPTAASHDRVMILEVMGRDAGHIALSAGIAGGADIILIPEIPYTFDNIAKKIYDIRENGRNFALLVVSEAVRTEQGEHVLQVRRGMKIPVYGGVGHYIADELSNMTEAETRVTVLGHVQRGGIPDVRDRLMASIFGVHAVDLLASGKKDRMVAWSGRNVMDVPLADVVARSHVVDPNGPLVKTARGLGVSFGDGY